MFVCPKCNERLARTKTEHGVFFVCSSCQGRTAGLSVVRKAAGRKTTKALWQEAIQKEAKPGIACPICNRETSEVPLPVEGGEVHLDVCIGCQFVWFDPKELEQLPQRPVPDEEPLPDEAREKIAVAEAESVAHKADFEERPYGGPPDTWKWIPGVFGMPVECQVPALRSEPWLTWSLGVTLVGLFFLSAANLESLVLQYGFMPADPLRLGGLTLLSAFFLHAGPWHLIGNTYFLIVFGDNVEDYLGRVRFVILLVLATAVGNLVHMLGEPHSEIPCIGASGGISGVITFYALKFPEARLGILLRFFLIFRWLYMPAYVALILWFLMQLFMVFLQMADLSNVSALAHMGGAGVGVAAWLMWREK